jgi:CubicO group peptidase (beta-lactamase class C family)
MKRPISFVALFSCAIGVPAFAQTASAPSSRPDFAREAAELLEANYRADAPGAAVLVARGDTVLFRAARGEADVEKDVPLRPDSLFRIGSVSKQFSAAGVLKLVEAGKVKLEDPVSKFVPDYPKGDRITVLQLLNHTSGVKSYTGLPGYMDGPIRRDLTTAQIIEAFKDEPPDFEPGEGWAYNNSGYILVGAVIEAASGKPWHAYLDEVLFKPLGMTHTGYGHDPKFAALHVRGYTYDAGKVAPCRELSMTQPHAAGALISNVDDLLKWNRALHEGRVLAPATYSQMVTPVGKAAESRASYGFGLFTDRLRNRDTLQHGGGIFGFVSALTYIQGPDVTVVVLENDDSPNGEHAESLSRRLAAMALGDPYPAKRAIPVDAAALEAAEGVYRFDAETTRVLRLVDGNLTAQRQGGPRAVLTPIAPDGFLYPDGFNRMKLERDAAGKITGMRFFANGEGDGVVGARTTDPLPSAPVSVRLSRAALERLVGSYSIGDRTMKIFLEGDALKAQISGQRPVSLRATSPTQFAVEGVEASLEFAAGDAPAAELTLRQNGREFVWKRAP